MTQIKAILFDLDGTLLDTVMEQFLPRYLQAVAARVAPIADPKRFIDCLLEATEVMIANDGRATNEEVFAEAFYPRVGIPRAELEPVFEAFYAEDFPGLRSLTRRKPEARPLVAAAFRLGYDVAIATNPLFPETAVRQRMDWAGVDDFPYNLVTTYENSRHTKPNPLYFSDICAGLGHAPEACLMVGDEHMDMVAALVGCPTYLVPGPSTALPPGSPAPTYRGDLEGLSRLIRQLKA